MDKKRDEQSIRIFKRLKEGPTTPKELADELKIPPSTVNHSLREVLSGKKWGLIKKIKNDKYAIIEYSEDEEIILNEYNRLKRLLQRSPTPEEISSFIKKTPEETRILLFKYIYGYSEPKEKEIEKSANKVCALIRQGMELINSIEIPDTRAKDYYFLNGYFYTPIFVGFDIQLEPWLLVSPDESRSYLEEFPEMKPEIEFSEDKETVWVKPVWPDKALIYIRKFSKYGENRWLFRNV